MELVVDLALVEGKFIRIVYPYLLGTDGVCVIALATDQLQAASIRNIHFFEERPIHAAWYTNGRPVLCAAVLGVSTAEGVFGSSVEIGLCEVANLALRNRNIHHLSMAHAAVVRGHCHIVVANFSVSTHLFAPCISSKSCDLGRLTAQVGRLLLHNFMLHMPEAALAHIDVDVRVSQGRTRCKCQRGKDTKRCQSGTCPRWHHGALRTVWLDMSTSKEGHVCRRHTLSKHGHVDDCVAACCPRCCSMKQQ
mmetsp:Transcript_41229/g.76691  ORF Transcript_41229/g.76691 Transcript_41229/m.76691 type:complete len:250 (+) Transcript_41229:286-1035(+)